jgi:hypothetical protein
LPLALAITEATLPEDFLAERLGGECGIGRLTHFSSLVLCLTDME